MRASHHRTLFPLLPCSVFCRSVEEAVALSAPTTLHLVQNPCPETKRQLFDCSFSCLRLFFFLTARFVLLILVVKKMVLNTVTIRASQGGTHNGLCGQMC